MSARVAESTKKARKGGEISRKYRKNENKRENKRKNKRNNKRKIKEKIGIWKSNRKKKEKKQKIENTLCFDEQQQ